MIQISHKAKQFLAVVAKLLVVAAAFYFIYYKLANDEAVKSGLFLEKIQSNFSFTAIFILLLLSFLNRFLEIIKWQNLISTIKNISIGEASKQVLAALTLSIFTPNGIGEYAGKALFYPKTQTKEIVFLNLVCNGIQMLLSILFGIAGLVWFNQITKIISNTQLLLAFGILAVIIGLVVSLQKIEIRGYSIQKLFEKINTIPKKVHRKNIGLAISRYMIFSHQNLLLFVLLGVELPYFTMMAAITAVYFLSSSLPAFQMFDFAIKGSVALLFFAPLGVKDWIPILVTTIMWFLNVVLPVVIGSFYVMKFKLK